MTGDIDGAEPADDESVQPFWLSAASYWMPAYYPVTAWGEHAPFASWLTAVMRPSSVVELGTHFGFSSFVFAEAASRLGISSTIDAVDSWEGDDQAGFYGEDVYDYVKGVALTSYADSMRLVRAYFAEARQDFQADSADILHIDGRHGYEDVLQDYTEWASVVREGGIVLFHDTAETENGFGVWRLWEQIAEPGRSFEFHHGHGLGVLAVGTVRQEPLRSLLEADEPTCALIRDDYERLGKRVAREAWLETLPAELAGMNAEIMRRTAHEAEQDAEIQRLKERVEGLLDSTSWRVTSPLRAISRTFHRSP